jgi:cytochrome c biogenesis protein CcmG/thiol:disulfide interchange protein DsbE
MARRFVPIAIFLGLTVLLIFGLYNAPNKKVIPSPLVGKPIPEFNLSVLGQEGSMLGTEELTGQPFILNVWASWCPACRVEHEMITAIARTELVPVYGLNYKDEPSEATRWLGRFGNPYTANLQDLDGTVAIDFGVYGAPETFLIDAQGVIRHKVIGPVTEQDWRNDLQPMILELINEARS